MFQFVEGPLIAPNRVSVDFTRRPGWFISAVRVPRDLRERDSFGVVLVLVEDGWWLRVSQVDRIPLQLLIFHLTFASTCHNLVPRRGNFRLRILIPVVQISAIFIFFSFFSVACRRDSGTRNSDSFRLNDFNIICTYTYYLFCVVCTFHEETDRKQSLYCLRRRYSSWEYRLRVIRQIRPCNSYLADSEHSSRSSTTGRPRACGCLIEDIGRKNKYACQSAIQYVWNFLQIPIIMCLNMLGIVAWIFLKAFTMFKDVVTNFMKSNLMFVRASLLSSSLRVREEGDDCETGRADRTQRRRWKIKEKEKIEQSEARPFAFFAGM